MPKAMMLAAAIALTAGASVAAVAGPQMHVTSDVRITVDARQVPLGRLIKQIAALAHVEDVTIDRSLENVLVSVKLDGATPAEAFRAVLADAGAEFAIRVGTGAELSVIAYALKPRGPAGSAAAPASVAKAALAKEEMLAMAAVAKGNEAAEEAVAPPPSESASDAPESHPDPVSAFLGRGGMSEAPAASGAPSAPAANPGQAVPLTMPSQSMMGGGGASKPTAPAAAPADLPTDPFARFLTVMSATTPAKHQ
jgi:hypothetical protein